MQKKTKVLLSNLPLPFDQIGSWTFEFNYLLKQAPLFDFVLSPNPIQSEVFRYCKKRKWFRGARLLPKQFLNSWVFRDYINELKRISKSGNPLQLLVIDDQALLDTLSKTKFKFPANTELIYYHHGHSVSLSKEVMDMTDRIFFLTMEGYRESVRFNDQFTPEVEILGNGVSSEIFFPLTTHEKRNKRKEQGFQPGEILITWMANSRPVKGLHLFEKMIPILLELNPAIKIIIIGNSFQMKFDTDRVIQKGKLSPPQVADILQVSDFYFFTSLWKEGFGLSLVEAIKCGNFILSSRNGGIEEVVKGYDRVRLIDNPNILVDWISEFSEILISESWREIDEKTRNALFDFFSLESWENRIRKALY